ncbi:MAG: GWxTD domain-containing protein [FCB group bacterium]|nr:GWxTD domain-containing protein [FCB group bacterium]
MTLKRILLVLLVWVALSSSLSRATAQHYNDEGDFVFRTGYSSDYIVLFTESPEKSRLRLFTSVVYDNLQFLAKDGLFYAEYRVSFTVLDSNGDFIAGDRVERVLETDDYYLTNSRKEFDWVESDFDLPPGNYKVLFEFKDKDSRETELDEKEVVISGLAQDNILISGPILLDSVIVGEDDQLSLQPGLSANVFDGSKSIGVYFETMVKNYPADLTVSYALIDSKGNERLTGKFQRHLDSAVLRDKFTLNVEEFNFDNYQLVLSVDDGEFSTRKTRKFRIHWPELPPTIRDLDKAIDQLTYIASEREITRLKEDYAGRKLEMFLNYWKKWGKSEGDSYKLMDEYFRRIYESNQSFSEGGWRSDRGHVYVLYGPPSEIDRHPYDLYSKAYEVWYYFKDNRKFYFIDEGGFGDFRLRSPLWQN